MATDLVSIGFKADTGDLRKAGKELDGLAAKGGRAEKNITSQSKGISKALGGVNTAAVGAAAGLAAIASAGVLLNSARRNIAIFTQSIADLSAITGASGRDLEFYNEQARQLGRTTSFTASQVVEGYKLIGSAKPDLLANSQALNEVTESALTLAEAAGISLPEAASALGSALNQFQLDASKASDVINVLAAGSKFGAAEIPAITEALRNAGPAANALSVDLAETVAGIEALAIAGRQGADAGTGLRQVLLRLERTADAELQPSIVGLVGAITELESRNLSSAELMKLFGDEAFTAGAALLSQTENLKGLNSSLRDTNTAIDQASTRMDTLQGDGLELSSAMEGLSLVVGGRLEPALRTATQRMTEFLNSITEALQGNTIASLEEDIASFEARLSSSRFFGRSGDSQRSALEQQLSSARLELALLKAEAGDLGAIASVLPELRNELEGLISGNAGRGQMSRGNADRIAELRAQIQMLETANAAGAIDLMTDADKAFMSQLSASQSVKDSAISISEKAAEKYKELTASLQEQINMLGMTDREAFAYAETLKLPTEATAEMTAKTRELALSLYDLQEAMNLGNQEITKITSADKEWMDSMVGLTERVAALDKASNPMMARYQEWIDQENEITKLMNAGLLTKEEAAEKIDQLGEAFDNANNSQVKLSDEAKRQAREFETAWKRGVERVDDMFADLWKSAFDGFKDFGSTLKNSFTGLLAELAHSALTRPIVMSFAGAMAPGVASANGAAAGATGGASAQGIFQTISQGFNSLNGGFQQGIATLGVKLYDFAPAIGDAIISNAGAIANIAPYTGAVISAIQGDMKGAAFQAVGTALGSFFGPVGAFIGGAIGGMFGGGGKQPDRTVTQLPEVAAQFTDVLSTSLKALGQEGNVSARAEYTGRQGGSGYGVIDTRFDGRRIHRSTRYKDAYGEETMQEFIEKEIPNHLRNALLLSGIEIEFKNLIRDVTGIENIAGMVDATALLIDNEDKLNDRFGITAIKAAEIASATGLANEELISYVQSMGQAAGAFRSTGEVLVDAVANLTNAYGSELPANIDAFDAALKQVDTTTKDGVKAFMEMFSLRADFADYRKTIDQLSSGIRGAIYSISTPSEQLIASREGLSALFEEFNLQVPKSASELIDIGKAIDLTTAEGINLAAVFPTLVQAFQQTNQQASQLADTLNSIDPMRFANVVDFRRARALNQNGIPGFANGGVHKGGLRKVGERGVEIEATGPSRIFNQSQLIDINPLLAEMKSMRAEMADLRASSRDTERNTRSTANTLTRVTRDGDSLLTKAV